MQINNNIKKYFKTFKNIENKVEHKEKIYSKQSLKVNPLPGMYKLKHLSVYASLSARGN